MNLMPEEIRAALPRLYTTENDSNQAVVSVKYFTPDSSWTWYPTEFDGGSTFFAWLKDSNQNWGILIYANYR